MSIVATDIFKNIESEFLSLPATDAIAIVPSDTDELTFVSRAIFVGTAGDLKVKLISGTIMTFKAPIGILPIRVRQVYDTGTDADDLVALW